MLRNAYGARSRTCNANQKSHSFCGKSCIMAFQFVQDSMRGYRAQIQPVEDVKPKPKTAEIWQWWIQLMEKTKNQRNGRQIAVTVSYLLWELSKARNKFIFKDEAVSPTQILDNAIASASKFRAVREP
ncbi:hypothetical protein AHAS_Ahas16G0224500 [Arachis hypogaea]